jgi:hypothetical protein
MSGPGVNAIYTNNIPFSSNNPSSDQPIMEQNTNSINSVLSVDHIAFNTSNSQGGYHNIIHMPSQLSKPATVTGIYQLFSMIPPTGIPSNTDNQLFSITGAGGFEQLSGNNAAPNGNVWCAGILLQWGFYTPSSGSSGGLFRFAIEGSPNFTFPNNCYAVFLQNAAPAFISLVVSPILTNAQFAWSASSTGNKFFWFAIGN